MSDDPLFPTTANLAEPAKDEAPKRVKTKKPATDRANVGPDELLSDADKQALREEAAKIVADDFKKEAKQRFLKAAVVDERMRYNPEEEVIPIQINLPGHSKCITINGREYQHAATYSVPLSLHRSLSEVMFRAWQHEDVVGGVNRDNYVKPPRDLALRPGMENFSHPNSSIMRV